MSFADNLKELLQKKNSSMHVNTKTGSGCSENVLKSQVNINKPQRRSTGRGK